MSFTLVIPGKPTGKGRARHGQGRTWTPRETVLAEQGIRAAWIEAGQPRLEGPLEVAVTLTVQRPASHFTSKGLLNLTGRRMPYPHRQKPDLDNALKLILDALNTRAWADDVQVVTAFVRRRWGAPASTEVHAQAREDETTAVAA